MNPILFPVRYRIYEYWEKRSWNHLRLKDIYRNYTLSELDKAFIQLMYPPDVRIPGKEQQFRKAMVTAGVPRKDASKMLSDFMQDDRSLSQRLTSIRDHFDRLKNNWWSLWNSKCMWFTIVQCLKLKFKSPSQP